MLPAIYAITQMLMGISMRNDAHVRSIMTGGIIVLIVIILDGNQY